MSTIEPSLAEHFAHEGFRKVVVIGSGMEGTVYRIAPGIVAKVWNRQSAERLSALRNFYDGIRAAKLSIGTPEIYEIWHIGEHNVSIEKEIVGRTLESVEPLRPEVWLQAVSCLREVLEQFAEVPPVGALCGLPVLDEDMPFNGDGQSWAEAITALIVRRVDRFGPILRGAVPKLDEKVRAVLEKLSEFPAGRQGLIHGDLVTANIVVDEDIRPIAVLDFGFLSMYGNVGFDAAITSSIFEMYGSTARQVERELGVVFEAAFDLSSTTLAVYRAAYALITSNAYDVNGEDGHFSWCASMLARPDISAVLGIGEKPT